MTGKVKRDLKKLTKTGIVKVIEELKTKYPIREMLLFLEIPKSSYYRWKRQKLSNDDQELIKLIKKIYKKHKKRYGYRRVTGELKTVHGLKINRKKVRRLMREIGLFAKIRRRKFVHYKPSESVKMKDLIKRKFKAEAPNQKWYTDVSTLTFGENHLYLSAIIDGFNNEVISAVISDSPNLKLAYDTVDQALEKRKINKVILHSDQGGLYTSPKFQAYVKEKNIIQSMSQKGVCYDNVQIESFFSHLKTEAFYSQDYAATNSKIIEIVKEYIYYYNNERIQIKLNNLPPIKYREQVAA
ncbi:IS3 family transposase [Bacillus sp. AFS055030]|uniref:IS3 family transposase n=1 Tax=Bacillus sp. AFS055030 TaxID=2033507 RepID=UPI0011558FE8|nr:IS3 family transposase [Bacillus sp. AFS055030]